MKLKSGGKVKEIIVLQANKNLSQHPKEDTLLDISIKAYALEDKENISVLRETTFIYPSPKSVKDYLHK